MPKGSKYYNKGAITSEVTSSCGKIFIGNERDTFKRLDIHNRHCDKCKTKKKIQTINQYIVVKRT